MKKWGVFFCIGMLVLAGCTSQKKATTKSSEQAKSSVTATQSTSTATSESSSSSVTSSSSSANVSSEPVSSASSSVSSSSSAVSSTTSGEITTSDQALAQAKTQVAELQSSDIGLTFIQQLSDGSFLLKAQSKSLAAQGGSGTVGFYKVAKDGTTVLTDANGTPQ